MTEQGLVLFRIEVLALAAAEQQDALRADAVLLLQQQVLAELGKVTKPTRKELINYTGVVLAFVAVVMVIISFLDWVFLNV
ncbi:MAG: preprotein translocase subunit SecE, partial [Pseudohongiellaceae bacterium]